MHVFALEFRVALSHNKVVGDSTPERELLIRLFIGQFVQWP